MPYADSAEVRSLIHNFTVKGPTGTDITTTVINDAIARGDSRVKIETGYSNWQTNDEFYPSVQEASSYFAANYILIRYFKSKQYRDEAMDMYQYALDICKSVADSTGVGVSVAHKAYKSYPLNPDGTIKRSLGPTNSGLEG